MSTTAAGAGAKVRDSQTEYFDLTVDDTAEKLSFDVQEEVHELASFVQAPVHSAERFAVEESCTSFGSRRLKSDIVRKADGKPQGSSSQGIGQRFRESATEASGLGEESMPSLEAPDPGGVDAVQEHPPGDAHGIPHTKDSRARRGASLGEQAQEEQGAGPGGQVENGNWKTAFPFSCPKRMHLQDRGLFPRLGLPSPSSRARPFLVHMPSLRCALGEVGDFTTKLFLNLIGRGGTKRATEQAGLSQADSTAQVSTGSPGSELGRSGQVRGKHEAVANCTTTEIQKSESVHGEHEWIGSSSGRTQDQGDKSNVANDIRAHRALPAEHRGGITDLHPTVRVGRSDDGLRGHQDPAGGSSTRPRLEQKGVRGHAQPMKLKATLLHGQRAASEVILMCSFVVASNPSGDPRQDLMSTSDEVPETSFQHHKFEEFNYQQTGECKRQIFWNDTFTSNIQTWKPHFDNLPCLLGQPSHLLFCTDENEHWKSQPWNPEKDTFLQTAACQYPTFCWVYPTSWTTLSLGSDLDWNTSAKNIPRGVKIFIEKSLRTAHGVDVMEVYSPPRLTLEAQKQNDQQKVRPRWRIGEALDLVTGYDFRRAKD